MMIQVFVINPIKKSYDKFFDEIIEEYPKKVNEIYRKNYQKEYKEYLDKQHGILEELIEKHRKINEMAKPET